MVVMRMRTIATVIAAIGLSALGLSAASAAPAATTPRPGHNGGLRVWIGIGVGEQAAGSTYYPLEFTNVSGHTVTIRGFPGVSAVNGSGQPGSPAAGEHTAAPVTVTLANGATAHTTLQIVNAYNFGSSKTATAAALKGLPAEPEDSDLHRLHLPGAGEEGDNLHDGDRPGHPGRRHPRGDHLINPARGSRRLLRAP